ncbi:Hypothetical predicted protein [Cloeon dipterum]|uniref:Ion transport domain-containing protein n=1 Tax=Cloeon dipterum TaxID=197152 RepID=A0A8S1BUH8_9INSE|nr:Hypothetical predicted protein [Cloeon dipterum]
MRTGYPVFDASDSSACRKDETMGQGYFGSRPKRRDRQQKLLMGPAKNIRELTERTLDLYWASRTGNHKLVASLLRRGADPTVCHPDSGEGPLHVAACHGHFKVVQELLENGCGPNVRTAFPADETALHVLVRNCSAAKITWTRAREVKCLREVLAAPGLDVDACDGAGLTAVHLAARFGLWDFVDLVLTRNPNLDLRIDGDTAREIILRDSGRQWNNLPTRRSESQVVSTLQILLACLRDRREDEFLQMMQSVDDGEVSKVEMQNCLKMACSYGCLRAVQLLLHRGADPNDFAYEPPVVMAAKLGHADVLQTLLETGTVVLNRCDHPLWQRSPLHLAVLSACSSSAPSKYLRCISLLLESRHGLDLDNVDFRGNTALHYAAKSPQRDLTRLLLRAGCDVFVCNQHNEPGFLHVGVDELRAHLDGFVSQKGLAARNHSLELDYQFLRSKRLPGGEMQPMLLLGRSKAHRPLLSHPLLTSFLHLKWQRLKPFFYCKFFAYFLFATALSVYIYHVVQATALQSTQYVRWISVGLLGVFVFGEVLEACVSIKRYLNNFENVLKLVLIVLSVVLLTAGEIIEPWPRRYVATATVICAYVELALLIGTHPRFATYIDMYLRVSRNFAGLFFLFSFLIFAFAFSFFVLYQDDADNKFFSTLGGSFFKTVIMLTGEMEADNLNTNLLGYLLFLAFVLFVPICLVNLVTGLAVSDIAAIRQEAEVGLIAAKVELYADIESLLLGSALQALPRCCCSFVDRKIRLLGNFLVDNKLVWYLDFDNKMEPDSSQVSWFSKFVPESLKKFRRIEWLAIVEEALKISSAPPVDQQASTIASLETKIEQMQLQIAELVSIIKKSENAKHA